MYKQELGPGSAPRLAPSVLSFFALIALASCATSGPAPGGTPEWRQAERQQTVTDARPQLDEAMKYQVEIRRISGEFGKAEPAVSRFHALYWTADFLRRAGLPELPSPQGLSLLANLFFIERPVHSPDFSGAWQEAAIRPYAFSGDALQVQNQFFLIDPVDSDRFEYPIAAFYLLTNVPLDDAGNPVPREVRDSAELGPGKAWFGQFLLFRNSTIIPLDWWGLLETGALTETRTGLAAAIMASDGSLAAPSIPPAAESASAWFVYFARIGAIDRALETLDMMGESDRRWAELVLKALELE